MSDNQAMSETSQMSGAALAFAEQAHTGLLVALWLDAETAGQLTVPSGEAADSLHVTLAYVPDATGWDDLTQARVIAGVDRAVRYRQSLTGKVGGYGRFTASETSDEKDVFYAAVDVPSLEDVRLAVEMELCDAGAPPSRIHGFTPHITLAYLDPGAANPVDRLPDLDLSFGAVTVLLGEKRIDIPLSTLSVFAVKDKRTDAGKTQDMLHVYQPVQFAEPPEWSPFLPIPGTYSHPYYGELNYTTETYERMIANFKDGIYQSQLPVNAEHDPQSSGAVGWIVDMRLAESGAIEVKVDWNDRGRALIEGDRYKYVSAELYPWWTDPVDPERNYQDVAIGMAITTQPYFKESVLPPLVASEAMLVLSAGDPGKETVTMADDTQPDVQTPADTPATDQPTSVQQATDQIIAQLSETMGGKKISDPVVTEFVERAARELAEARSKAAEHEKQATQLSEQNAMLQAQNRVKFFTDEVLGRSDHNGTPWVGDVAGHVRMACSLADKFGTESWELKHYVADNRAHAEQATAGSLFKEIGTARDGNAGLTAYDQIAAQAAERAKSTNETFAQAFDAVLMSDHALRAALAREER